MAFYVGQKVVCVDDRRGEADHSEITPVKCQIYTVRDVVEWRGQFGLRVHEILNPVDPWLGEERAFYASRFRPVVERKTDISIFKAMLNPSREDVSA